MISLPIDIILPELRRIFQHHHSVVLSADPGAGKTTRVPPALVDEQWLNGKKIIMLEPRRLAAIRSAEYMSLQLGERAGQSVGYRIRGENKTGNTTRIEIVTEGILTRMIQDDASLPGVGLVIFDEFHERSIHADLGLALVLDAQKHLCNDLKILVMSATLNGLAVSSLLGDAPIVKSEGRSFPVETKYLSQPNTGSVELLVANTVVRALREEEGDILVFLPGQGEIRKVNALLGEKELPDSVEVHVLYGEATSQQQQSALQPVTVLRRKVILSTSIAETSLTIDGVRIVIDSGLSRSATFDPRRGMSGLITTTVSQASADQHRGRAGRQKSGVCYRLWMEHEHANLPMYSQPEILVIDLAPLQLELAQWGDPDGIQLRFLDPPPEKHLRQARALLKELGAVDNNGKLTDHGKKMSRLGIHPRLSHMLIRGNELEHGACACDMAALLEERDILRERNNVDVDFLHRWNALRTGEKADRFIRERVLRQTNRLRTQLRIKETTVQDPPIGLLLALAYPERIAKRRTGAELKYQLSGNTVGLLPKNSALSREEYIVIADVDGAGNEVKIFLAAAITKREILDVFANQIEVREEVRWDDQQGCIVARKISMLGALELSEQSIVPPHDNVKKILCEVIRKSGLQILPWEKESESIRNRSEWLRKRNLVATNWVDLSDDHLLRTLEEWLGPYLTGIKKLSQFTNLDMKMILKGLFSYDQLRELDRLAPTHCTVPTGSHIPIDYSNDQPVLSVRLQEMFGETKTPTVADGKVKLLLHLLSPAKRPLAVTQDLPSFWNNGYVDVRKDMRGQYPKHYWPDNPLEAEPTRRTKKYM